MSAQFLQLQLQIALSSPSLNITYYSTAKQGRSFLAMASMTMASLSAAIQAPRLGSGNVVRAVPARGSRAGRNLGMQVAAAVQFDYDTKVFKKELVKFADTEEYIYR